MRFYGLVMLFLQMEGVRCMRYLPTLSATIHPQTPRAGAKGFTARCSFDIKGNLMRRLALHLTTPGDSTTEVTNVFTTEYPLHSDAFSSFTRPDPNMRSRVRLEGRALSSFVAAVYNDTRCSDTHTVFKCVLEYQMSLSIDLRRRIEKTITLRVLGCTGGVKPDPTKNGKDRRFIPVEKVWPDTLKPSLTLLAGFQNVLSGTRNKHWVWCNYTAQSDEHTHHRFRRIVVFRTPRGGVKNEVTNLSPIDQRLSTGAITHGIDLNFRPRVNIHGSGVARLPWVALEIFDVTCDDADTLYTCELEYYYPSRVHFRYKMEVTTTTGLSVEPKPPEPITADRDLNNAQVKHGHTMTFTCSANVGAPAGQIHWYTFNGVPNSPLQNVTRYAKCTSSRASKGCHETKRCTLTLRVSSSYGRRVSVRCRVWHQLLSRLNPTSCSNVEQHYCRATPFITVIGGVDPKPPPRPPPHPQPGLPPRPDIIDPIDPAYEDPGGSEVIAQVGTGSGPTKTPPGGQKQEGQGQDGDGEPQAGNGAKSGKATELSKPLTLTAALCVVVMVTVSGIAGFLMWKQRRNYKQDKAAFAATSGGGGKNPNQPKVELITTGTPTVAPSESDEASTADSSSVVSGSSAGESEATAATDDTSSVDIKTSDAWNWPKF